MSVPGITLDNDIASPLTLAQNNLPDWLKKASPDVLSALKNAPTEFPDWIKNVSVEQRSVLKKANDAYWEAQNAAEKTLQKIPSPEDFAEPLLQAELKKHGLDLDVRKTFIRLYTATTLEILSIPTGIPSGAARGWIVSLLDAALHNFEETETQVGAFESDSCFITAPNEEGNYEVLDSIPKKLSIEAFAALCRTLDLGAQYGAMLKENLGFNAPVVEAVLQPILTAEHKATLLWSLEQALAQKSVQPALAQVLRASIEQQVPLVVEGRTWTVRSVEVLSCKVAGALVFALNPVGRMVAYLPNDPEQPLKEYATSLDFSFELARRLRDRDYRRFFSCFIAHQDLETFFSTLPTRLWSPGKRPEETLPPAHAASVSEPVGELLTDAFKASFPKSPPESLVPIKLPSMGVETWLISGDLWGHLFEQKRQRLLNDGQYRAVTTEAADRKVRERSRKIVIGILETVAQVGLGVVASFVPPLGALMLAYSAYQVLDDVIEGVIDWSADETTQALQHLTSLVNSASQFALFAAGGAVAGPALRAVLPSQVTRFFEDMTPVTLKNDQSRLWNRDMRPYEREFPLDNDSQPDELGLRRHGSQKILPLEGKHYGVTQDATSAQHRIVHPLRDTAYQPQVRTNRGGAWLHEAEEPLDWETRTLVRRLGGNMEDLSDESAERVMQISGAQEATLRKVHLDTEQPPGLLTDVQTRVKIAQDLDRFHAQMTQADLSADPYLQLQLLTDLASWPKTKVLRVIDEDGATVKEYGNGAQASVPRVQVSIAQIRRGDVLKTVLECLSKEEIGVLLGRSYEGAGPQLQHLRHKIIEQATLRRAAVIEAQYKSAEFQSALKYSGSAWVALIQAKFPDLPMSVVEELLQRGNHAEWTMLENGIVPLRMIEEARLYAQELRLNRAYESFFLNIGAHSDSELLALQTLAQLPGWSAALRLEVYEQVVEKGRLVKKTLNSVGPQEGSIRRGLLKKGDKYIALDDQSEELSGELDLYSAVLHALPDAERTALGFPSTGQGEALHGAVLALSPLPRPALRKSLGMPWLTPDYRSPMGGAIDAVVFPMDVASSGAMAGFDEKNIRLFQQLFRTSLSHGRRVLGLTSSDPAVIYAQLTSLQHGYAALERSLARWETEGGGWDWHGFLPRRTPSLTRQTMVRRIKAFWRIEGSNVWSHILDLSDLHTDGFPSLPFEFPRVTTLKLNNVRGTSEQFNTFIRAFPNLRALYANNSRLTEIPANFSQLTRLSTLELARNQISLTSADVAVLSRVQGPLSLNVSSNGITLTPAIAEQLTTCTSLQSLNLDDNPLGIAPNLAGMQGLRVLSMANTGLTQWPVSLEQSPRLELVALDDNQIADIPASAFEADGHPQDERRVLLHSNPLSAETLERIAQHRGLGRRTVFELGELNLDHQVQRATDPVQPWLMGLVPEQHVQLKARWSALRREDNSEGFFRVIDDLTQSADYENTQFRPELSRRVWQMLEAAENTSALRLELFRQAVEMDTCVDGVSEVFSRLGFELLLDKASHWANIEKVQAEYLRLAKARSRLQRLDKIATAEFDRQLDNNQNPDEVEIFLAYRVNLAQRLELPWQPQAMRFRAIAQVTDAKIEAAYKTILEQEEGTGLVDSLVKLDRPFWVEHLESRYADKVDANNEVFQEKLGDLDDLRDAQRAWMLINDADGVEKAAARKTAENLAKKLNIADTKIFTGKEMSDEEYVAQSGLIAEQRLELLRELTREALAKLAQNPLIEDEESTRL